MKWHRLVPALGLIALSVMDIAFFSPNGLTNGFFTIDTVQGYHIALWFAGLCFLYSIVRD